MVVDREMHISTSNLMPVILTRYSDMYQFAVLSWFLMVNSLIDTAAGAHGIKWMCTTYWKQALLFANEMYKCCCQWSWCHEHIHKPLAHVISTIPTSLLHITVHEVNRICLHPVFFHSSWYFLLHLVQLWRNLQAVCTLYIPVSATGSSTRNPSGALSVPNNSVPTNKTVAELSLIRQRGQTKSTA